MLTSFKLNLQGLGKETKWHRQRPSQNISQSLDTVQYRSDVELIDIVLEIASGFGEAISYLADIHPEVIFVPSDAQDIFLNRLLEISEKHANMREPLLLNVFSDTQWKVIANRGPFDCILAFNLVHLIPWEGTKLLFQEANRILDGSPGVLALYGAFKRNGEFVSLNDRAFDEDIRSRDPRWGLRDLEEVTQVATEHGFRKEEIIEMPKGNWMLILYHI